MVATVSGEVLSKMTGKLVCAIFATSFLMSSRCAWTADITLTIESWRENESTIWQQKIIPTFEKSNPGIKVVFAASPPTEYDAALSAKLKAGKAGDLVSCRPFDQSLQLFQQGYLDNLTMLPGMENFSSLAKLAWQTDDAGSTFCVPIASVIHGFIYNADAFKLLGVTVPTTEDEFFAVLDKLKIDSRFVPIAMGTKDQWEAATVGYQNIGPNYWQGEQGRTALIKGDQKLTDSQWVEPYSTLAKWKPYLGDGAETQSYPDSQYLFTRGRAAIYPAGSWEIAGFKEQINGAFEVGAFAPPTKKAGDVCYISDHSDVAMGLNAKSKKKDAAKKFLSWIASKEFADLYANALPGFFSLNNYEIALADPIAKEFVSWRGKCKSTIRSTYQILSRGTPNLERATWVAAANVINDVNTPKEAGEKLQKGLDSWYKPGE